MSSSEEQQRQQSQLEERAKHLIQMFQHAAKMDDGSDSGEFHDLLSNPEVTEKALALANLLVLNSKKAVEVARDRRRNSPDFKLSPEELHDFDKCVGSLGVVSDLLVLEQARFFDKLHSAVIAEVSAKELIEILSSALEQVGQEELKKREAEEKS